MPPRQSAEMLLAQSALNHEKIEPYWRSNLAHFHDDHRVDAKPQRIDTSGLNHRQNHRCGQNHYGDAIQKTAQIDIKNSVNATSNM